MFLLFAPPTSGVYGLFNFDCQLFIGESANIREALLRHKSETDFQPQHLQATGFTFEPCAAELRKYKADDLIARFHPLLQTEAALRETWSTSNSPSASEAGLGGLEKTYPDRHEFPLHEREKQPKVRRHFYFKRTYGAALAAMFGASVIVIFYFRISASKIIQKQVKSLPQITITQPPVLGQAKTSLRPQECVFDRNGGRESSHRVNASEAGRSCPRRDSESPTLYREESFSRGRRTGSSAFGVRRDKADHSFRGKPWEHKVVSPDFRGTHGRYCQYPS